jgi:hypothetical protein
MKSNLEKLIISEATKIIKENKYNLHLKENVQKIHECNCGCNSCDSKPKTPEYLNIEFETVEPYEFAKEAEEASMLSEEINRMKQLLNFNNPFFKL